MAVCSDYTKYGTYFLDFYDNRRLLGIGRGCGQWAWPGDMIGEGPIFPDSTSFTTPLRKVAASTQLYTHALKNEMNTL